MRFSQKTLIALCTAFVSLVSAAYANNAPVRIKQDMSYAEARNILINDGWQPITKRWQERMCDADIIDECKFTEMESCAMTGTGPCIANFGDLYRNTLKVHSAGHRGKWITRFYFEN